MCQAFLDSTLIKFNSIVRFGSANSLLSILVFELDCHGNADGHNLLVIKHILRKEHPVKIATRADAFYDRPQPDVDCLNGCKSGSC